MAEEMAFENRRIFNFQGLMTLTLDRVILYTVVQHSSTYTYIPNFIKMEETFCGQTDGHLTPTVLGRLRTVNLKIQQCWTTNIKITVSFTIHSFTAELCHRWPNSSTVYGLCKKQ